MQRNEIQSVARSVMLAIVALALLAMLNGCSRSEETVVPSEQRAPEAEAAATSALPLGHEVVFNGITLRANVSRSDVLPDEMARQYGIESAPDRFLLNVVVLERGPEGLPVSVAADVNARLESLIGHVEVIGMRALEADSHVSYVGSIDAKGRRAFQVVVEARPEGAHEPLQMSFEVLTEAIGIEGHE